jgi:hypothetical protein
MLRLVLDWYSRHNLTDHPLLFQPRSTWFSEALLPSPFRPRHHGDTRAESRTHADGIVGHISVGSSAKADARLLTNATQLIVIEAKIYSPLSGSTKNAPGFDQAARNIACITELLSRANRPPTQMTSLSFFVLAPVAQINTGIFAQKLDKESIRVAVQTRAQAFKSELGNWLDEWFFPTLQKIRVEALSWETLISQIETNDPDVFQSFQGFYERCLILNGPGVQHASV